MHVSSLPLPFCRFALSACLFFTFYYKYMTSKMNFATLLGNLKREASTALDKNLSTKRPCLTSSNLIQTKDHRGNETPPVSRIFLACPANVQTGGPEAMHQLCHKINSLYSDTVTAYMLYLKVFSTDTGEDGYVYVKNAKTMSCYKCIYPHLLVAESFPSFESSSNERLYSTTDLIIWPECWTQLIDKLPKGYDELNEHGRFLQTAIWWLSVDNNNSRFKDWKTRNDILHLYQSEYAKSYIVSNLQSDLTEETLINYLPMTEYIPMRCETRIIPTTEREIDILYNPLKGIHFTDEIRKRSEGHFTFQPIGGERRLSPEEVSRLLHRAKVYIDFGTHPGMDRLPREAALSFCIVVTNMSGSAQYDEDLPIPKDYKIKHFDVDVIHKLLSDCLTNYETKVKDFDHYRHWIHKQEQRMDKCVEAFIKFTTEKPGQSNHRPEPLVDRNGSIKPLVTSEPKKSSSG